MTYVHDVYQQPPVHVGQTVVWMPDPGCKPYAAIVTEVGTRTVGLAIHPTGYLNHLVKDGVVHISDPTAEFSVKNEMGLWDYTDGDKKRRKTASQIAEESKTEESRKPAARPRREEILSQELAL